MRRRAASSALAGALRRQPAPAAAEHLTIALSTPRGEDQLELHRRADHRSSASSSATQQTVSRARPLPGRGAGAAGRRNRWSPGGRTASSASGRTAPRRPSSRAPSFYTVNATGADRRAGRRRRSSSASARLRQYPASTIASRPQANDPRAAEFRDAFLRSSRRPASIPSTTAASTSSATRLPHDRLDAGQCAGRLLHGSSVFLFAEARCWPRPTSPSASPRPASSNIMSAFAREKSLRLRPRLRGAGAVHRLARRRHLPAGRLECTSRASGSEAAALIRLVSRPEHLPRHRIDPVLAEHEGAERAAANRPAKARSSTLRPPA